MTAKKGVRLKDKETTFFDPETKLKVVGDQVAELDPKKGKGKLTNAAIISGGLIEVSLESKDAGEKKEINKEKSK